MPSWEVGAAPEISPLQLGSALLKRWKLAVGLPMGSAVLAAIISLIVPAKYSARATFVAETESREFALPGALANLASQFGVGIPGSPASPKFYVDVLQSRTLQDQILLASFANPRTDTPGDSASLLDILRIDGDTEAERLEDGRRELDDRIAVGADKETGIITVFVTTRYPALSAHVANLLVQQLNRFNLETRQLNGRQRRQFTGERLVASEQELENAEEALRLFLDRNHQFAQSAELTFQHERLQRQVRLKEQVYTTLLQQHEEARIQEVNDTPLITVIDRAVPPSERSSPKRVRTVILAFLAGGVLAVFGAFGAEYLERARNRNDDDVREMAARWEQVKQELRSLVTPGRSSASS